MAGPELRLEAGARFAGRYDVIRALGEGGSASTYCARDALRDELVVLKLLRDERLVAHFRDEFAVLRGCTHPHLTEVRDLGVAFAEGRAHYYTARFVDGGTLAEFAKSRTWDDVAPALADVLAALDFLHRMGIRHGDVKPANAIVREGGRAVLIDLGCSGPLDARDAFAGGTPGYLAPEIFDGRADRRADLFAFGKTLEALDQTLAGALPDRARCVAERLVRIAPAERPNDCEEVADLLGLSWTPRALGSAARMVGRDAELARGAAIFDRLEARRERPPALWIEGPPGSGRSRLLRELKWTAQLRFERVAESEPLAPLPIAEFLARARGLDRIGAGASACVEELALLAEAGPSVLVLDDVDRLRPTERDLLLALVRTLGPADPVLFLLSSVEPPPFDSVERVEIGPLDRDSVAAWCRGRIAPQRAGDLFELTAGYPLRVAALLDAVGDADASREDLERHARASRPSDRELALIDGLPEDAVAAAACVALLGSRVDASAADELEIRESIALLEEKRLVESTAGGFALRRGTRSVVDSLAPSVRAACEGRASAFALARAERSSGRERNVWLATAMRIALGARDLVESERIAAKGDPRADPATWAPLVEELARETGDVDRALAAIELHELSGRPERALDVVDGLEPSPRVALARGSCLLRQAKPREALEAVRDVLAGTDPELRARAADVACRAEIRLGEHRSAEARAREALNAVLEPGLEGRLREDLGVALSYQARYREAQEELDRAESLQADAPRDRVRATSYRGINLYHLGRTREAVTAYRSALAISEEHGLADQIAATSLNLGSALQQLGDWGGALACYARGRRVALALDRASTVVTIDFNEATIHTHVGLLDRARVLAERVRADAERLGLSFFVAAATSLLGDIARREGEFDRASELLTHARAKLAELDAHRDAIEAELHLLEVLVERGDTGAAERAIDRLAREVEAIGSADVSARAKLVFGRVAARAGDHARATELLTSGLRSAEESAQPELEAALHAALSEVWSERGARTRAQRHAAEARERLELVAATLPPHLRDPFWRAHGVLPEPETSEPPARSERTQRLERLVRLSSLLSSTLEAPKVLELALDSALELADAERGFVLLADDGGFSVATARNLGRDAGEHARFSQGIARRVVETGAPVFSLDPGSDAALRDNHSVHALALRTVLCFPLRTPDGIVGAFYLDNRFRRARAGADLELLQAFADHAALALRNARLLGELEEERKRVEALLRDQAAEIGRLQEEVDASRAALGLRYDYSRIAGESEPMRKLFSLLDRITDSSASVLVEGESGTGKELIARALHFNGPRRRMPFVSVNCGALTETLLESELFGHVKGAFTGADRDKPGLFVQARGGTLFLDEVGEMSTRMQVKLLRALQERRVRPVGGASELEFDVRVLAATNRTLLDEVKADRFREDLYYRLGVVVLRVPPLRERKDDIPILAQHLLRELARAESRDAPKLSTGALERLVRHDWPGNVRELQNCIQRAALLSNGAVLRAADLGLGSPSEPPKKKRRPDDERASLVAALREHDWNVIETCRDLGIPRASFYRKLRRYRIERPRDEPG